MKHSTRPRLATPAGGSRRAALSFALLTVAVLVVAHDLTYLAASGLDGLGAALARSGHGAYWPFTWLVAAAGLMGLAVVAFVRAARLLRAVRAGGARAPLLGLRAYGAEVLRLWPRLALLALLVFVAQEAGEHYLMHGGHVLGVADFVSGAYAAALPAFAGVALLVAGIAALFRRTIDALEEALRSARVTVRRLVARIVSPPPRLTWLRSSLAVPDIGRAPPLLLAMC